MTKIISAIFCFSLLFSSPAEAHTRTVKQCHIVKEYVPTRYVDRNGFRHGGLVKIPAHYRQKRICKNVIVRSPHHHVVVRRTHGHHRHPHRVRFGVRINL